MNRLAPLALAFLVACGGGTTTPQHGASGVRSKTLPPPDPSEVGLVLAKVGEEPVGSTAFENAAARKQPASGKTLTAEEKREVLDELITEEVLYQEAFQRGYYRDPKVRKIMMNLLLREEVYGNVRNSDFTQDELRAYFREHQDEFIVPEKVQVMRILIKTDKRTDDQAQALAKDIRSQIATLAEKYPPPGAEKGGKGKGKGGKAGKAPDGPRGGVHRIVLEEFKELANEYSEDPYKRRGGDLGYVSHEGKPGIDTEVVDKAFEMEVGEVSKVFKTAKGYNIVLLANRRSKVERTFEQMKGSVLRKLKNEKYKELTDQYISKVKGGYTISIDEAALGSIDIQPGRRVPMEGMPLRGKAGIEERGGPAKGPRRGDVEFDEVE